MLTILGFVFFFAKNKIVDSSKNAEIEKIKSVLPAFDNDPLDSAKTFDDLIFYTAKKSDSIIGYACKTFTEKGFNGRFSLMVGFLPNGKIYRTTVLDENETPGFGSRIKTSWHDQFNGKDLTTFNLKVKKDDGEVDAISSATISSRAYCDAIEKAYISLTKNILKKTDAKLASEKNSTYVLKDISIIKKVLPSFDNNPLKEVKSFDGIDCYTATKNNKTVGYAVKSSARGYNGMIWILTGILLEGKIYDVEILQSNESVGYGARLNEPGFLSQFKGKIIGKCKFEVSNDGGDIDALSGATISSRAFCEALDNASKTFSQNLSLKKEEAKKDSIVIPVKPTVYQFSDKSIFNGVLPAFDNDPLKEFKSIDDLDLYIGKQNGNISGIAVTTFSNKGYGGKIVLLVGFTTSGSINNIAVILQKETENMGSQIKESYFTDQFVGKNPATTKLIVKEDGGDVDAISGCTISSRAFCEAVQKAYYAFKEEMKK